MPRRSEVNCRKCKSFRHLTKNCKKTKLIKKIREGKRVGSGERASPPTEANFDSEPTSKPSKNEFEEYEGVLMLLQDQTTEEKCLEVIRRYKSKILREASINYEDKDSKDCCCEKHIICHFHLWKAIKHEMPIIKEIIFEENSLEGMSNEKLKIILNWRRKIKKIDLDLTIEEHYLGEDAKKELKRRKQLSKERKN